MEELRDPMFYPIHMRCAYWGTIHIASTPMFHECPKHIEVGSHFMRKKIEYDCTPFIRSREQLADKFTKALPLDRM